MAIVNPPYKEILSEEDLIMMREDEESNRKVQHIETELELITASMRENVNALFQRGEKFDQLAQKSEQLKSVSSVLKKKAV